MRAGWLLVVAMWLPGTALAAPADRDALGRARLLYNQGQYDAAIAAATEAKGFPANAAPASLVIGRAKLERFRQSGDAADLAGARAALVAIDVTALYPRDRTELEMGLAEALYLEDAFGAAAELFESLLDRALDVNVAVRDRVLDWWASALDREAQGRPRAERDALYARVIARTEEELRHDLRLGAASYWLVAAARGVGNLDRAWNAALAGWVRAPLALDRGAALRADLDRLVREALIPERVRRLTGPHSDGDQMAAGMQAEWELFKQNWTAKY